VSRLEPYASLGLALAAGLLIGLERERSRPTDLGRDSFLGGARTHPLLALGGGVAMLAAREIGPAVVAIAFAALVLLLVVSYAGDVLRGVHRGITSEAAFVLSFLLGVLALTRGVLEPLATKLLVVASVAVVATYLLSSKPTLHPLARRVTAADVSATLKFLVVAVVVLPLLPDESFGPFGVLNPFQIGVLVVLISGLSFVGYAGIRLLGPRLGLGLTGVVGGLVSSTAVTLAMSGRARERPAIAAPAALAVMLASTVMFVRVLVIVVAVKPSLVAHLAAPLLAAAAAGAGASLVLWLRARRPRAEASEVAFSNPFELESALGFALLLTAVLLGSKAASVHLGTAGTYAAGVLAGTTDVDAISLSMAKLAGAGVSPEVAATTIFLGAASNTIVKGVMAVVAGGRSFGGQVLAAQLAALAAGAVGLATTWLAG
jgi:uncharacterized membrane protein (DUF4010 family)